jgi:hypothetical protein
VNQLAIGIEGAEQAGLVEAHSGLHAFQSILGDEKTASLVLSWPQNCTARRGAS